VLLSWEDRGAEVWSWNLDGGQFSHDRELVIRRTVHQAAAGRDPGAA
jgi:hypothetical protein